MTFLEYTLADIFPGFKLVRKILEGEPAASPPANPGLPPIIPPGAIIGVPSYPNAPKATVPEISMEKPKLFFDAKRKKIRYGPYRLPGSTVFIYSHSYLAQMADNSRQENNTEATVMHVNGMMDAIIPGALKPCETCTLAMVNADLEYFDGRPANTASGAWLHHTVVMSMFPISMPDF
jgi:hypothetical protein